MRLSLTSLFMRTPFEHLQKHADKVKECGNLFKEAARCYVRQEDEKFDTLTEDVARIESEADGIKRDIRTHLPSGIFMPVDKFQFFQYLREQDNVLDEMEEALFWLSFRPGGIPDDVADDFLHLVDSVIPTIEKLSKLVSLATDYFTSNDRRQRKKIISLIRDIHQEETEADFLERELKVKVFGTVENPLAVYHMIQLATIVGNIANHAENASDRMEAMIAR